MLGEKYSLPALNDEIKFIKVNVYPNSASKYIIRICQYFYWILTINTDKISKILKTGGI